MAITTVEEFLAVLEKSRLLSDEQLADVRKLAEDNKEPKDIAKALARHGVITRWQAGQLLAGRSAFFLGNYKLVELLGRAGMSNVFLGEHTTMNRQVALKIVSRRIGKDAEVLKRFLAEARLAAALDHPNIRRTYSVDSQSDRYYVVMEYIDGTDLQTLIEQKGTLAWEQAADFVRQVADALAYAHSQNVFHGPIMPSGLMVNDQQAVKILDMGTTRLTKRGESESYKPNEQTPDPVDYQAPEQSDADGKCDKLADIYSLGCMLYFLLIGRPPFADGTPDEKIEKHRKKQPASISAQRSGVPKGLRNICRKMMAKKPSNRFHSAEDVSRVTTNLLQSKHKLKTAAVSKTKKPPAKLPGKKPPVVAADATKKPADATKKPAGKKPPKTVKTKQPAAKSGFPEISFGEESDGITSVATMRRLPTKKPLLTSEQQRWVIIGGSLLAAVVALAIAVPMLLSSGGDSGKGNKTGDGGTSSSELREFAQTEEEKDIFDLEESFEDPDEILEELEDEELDPLDEEPEDEDAESEESTEEEQTDAEPEQSETEVEETPTPEPEPKSEPEPEPKPEPKPPKELPPTFRDFPKVVGLPAPELVEPFELGKIHARDEAPWEITLAGGQTALKSGQEFVVEPDGSDDPATKWTICHRRASRGGVEGESTGMAKVYYEGGVLKFQWLADAANVPVGCLASCVLLVDVDGETRPLALTKPQQVEPIVVDLQRRMPVRVIKLDNLPDKSKLRLEVKLGKSFGACQLEPSEPIEPKKQVAATVFFMDRHNNRKPGATFLLRFSSRRDGLTIGPKLESPPANVFMRCQLDENQKEMIEETRKKLLGQLKEQKGHAGKATINAQLDKIKLGLWYADFFSTIHNTGKIHFRIFAVVDDHQVDLVRTEPPKKKGK